MSLPQDGTPASPQALKANRSTQNLLVVFLTVTLILSGVGILFYGIVTDKVPFSGSIDVSTIAAVVIIASFTTILRASFGKNNVG